MIFWDTRVAAIKWQHQNIKTRRRPPIRPPPTPPVLLRAVRNNNPRYNPLRARCPCHRDSIITMVSPFLLFLSAFLRREELFSGVGIPLRTTVTSCASMSNTKFLWSNPKFLRRSLRCEVTRMTRILQKSTR